MKNAIIALLLVAAAALGALCVVQHNKLQAQAAENARTQTRLAAIEQELKEKEQKIERAVVAEQKAAVLQKAVTETAAAAVEKSQQVEKLQQTLADAKTNNMGNLIGNILKDPKMKEMIKAQQKLYIGPMIERSYGAFIEQLKLTPEQTTAFKDLLEKKMLVAANTGTSLLDNSLDAQQRADLVKQIKSETDAYDAQIKEFLGDENYQSFQTYEKSAPDRMTVNQFSDQLANGNTALTASQQDQLIRAMTEERNAFKWTMNFNQQDSSSADPAAMFTDENINQFAQEKERFDQQFLTRARQILTPEQVTELDQFQKSQRDLQIAGMKIAAKMFGGQAK